MDQETLTKAQATQQNPLEDAELQNPELQDNEYIAQSDACTTLNTIVPLSMRYEMQKALETVDRRVNGVDEYIAFKLGYCINGCTAEEYKEGMSNLCNAFAAEQVDALANAIYNIEEKEQGIVIGDQTGIGKGRVAAGLIRYGTKRGMKPIFITEKANLFSDIYRDLIDIESDDAVPLEVLTGYKEIRKAASDIEEAEEYAMDESRDIIKKPQYTKNKNYHNDTYGKKQIVPFIVNGRQAKTAIKSEDGDIIYKGLPKLENDKVIASQRVPDEYDCIIATYSQFRSSKENDKMRFLRAVAQNNIIIMDESHNASGTSFTGRFLREVLVETLGVCFLSATFAKRPDNMPIYASKTSISEANLSDEALVQAIKAGGVALQEILAAQLVAEGQMVRRERSFDGVAINYIYLDDTQELVGKPNLNKKEEHRAISDRITEIIRDIIAFQEIYVNPIIDNLDTMAKAECGEVETRKGMAKAGVDNVPFFSGIFNLINQLLFSIKVDAVAEIAIERLEEGKKVVVAFANTMESFLNNLTNNDGSPVSIGDRIPADFSEILKKRLDSVLKYTTTAPNGEKEHDYIVVEVQDDVFQEEYNRILGKITEATVGIHISPIDVLRDKIAKAGYNVEEVTGRSRELKILSDDTAQVKVRNRVEPNDAYRMFNDNQVDCLLINQSASTGASGHAKVTDRVPADKVKQRVMLVLQSELNINTEVQKRGRINRTGQIIPPIYDYVVSTIPAEQRMTMMLQRKLKSLDANTTSNQKESTKVIDINDFLNKYGDKIVVEYLQENPMINKIIGDPLKMEKKGEDEVIDSENAAHRVSGRIAILSTQEQEDFYTEIMERYEALVDYLRQTGEYDLEVDDLNLEAETLEKDIVVVGKGGESAFGRHSILEKCEVNVLKKPLTKIELESIIKDSLGEHTAERLREIEKTKLVDWTTTKIKKEIKEQEENTKSLLANINNEKQIQKLKGEAKKEAIIARQAAINDAHDLRLVNINKSNENRQGVLMPYFKFFYVGRVVAYPSISYAIDGSWMKAVFLGFAIKEGAKNQYTPSQVKCRFAIANSDKYVAIPASKHEILNTIKSLSYEEIMSSDQEETIEIWDELIRESSKSRQTRYIVTGNILQAFGNPDLKGKLVSYTTKSEKIKKGILLPETFNPEPSGRGAKPLTVTVPILQALTVIKAMTVGSSVHTTDQLSIIKKWYEYRIVVPLAKKRGGKFYEDRTIMRMTEEGLFNKTGSTMTATVSEHRIDDLVEYLQNEFSSNIEISQGMFGIIKYNFKIEDYDDEEVDVEKEKELLNRLRAEENAEKARKEKERKERLEEEEKRQPEPVDPLRGIKGKLLEFAALLEGEKMGRGGVIRQAEDVKNLWKATYSEIEDAYPSLSLDDRRWLINYSLAIGVKDGTIRDAILNGELKTDMIRRFTHDSPYPEFVSFYGEDGNTKILPEYMKKYEELSRLGSWTKDVGIPAHTTNIQNIKKIYYKNGKLYEAKTNKFLMDWQISDYDKVNADKIYFNFSHRSGRGATYFYQSEDVGNKYVIDSEYFKNLTKADTVKQDQEYFAKFNKYLDENRDRIKRILKKADITPEQKEQKRIKTAERAKAQKQKKEEERQQKIAEFQIPNTISEFYGKDYTTCTDATKGDVVLFTEPVFSGHFRKATYEGDRQILGIIEKESYGEKRGQHSFTIYVLDSDGEDALETGDIIRRTGRKMYDKCNYLQYASEEAREEKHARGRAAQESKYWTWLSEAEYEGKTFKLAKVPRSFINKNKEHILDMYPTVASHLNLMKKGGPIGVPRYEDGGEIKEGAKVRVVTAEGKKKQGKIKHILDNERYFIVLDDGSRMIAEADNVKEMEKGGEVDNLMKASGYLVRNYYDDVPTFKRKFGFEPLPPYFTVNEHGLVGINPKGREVIRAEEARIKADWASIGVPTMGKGGEVFGGRFEPFKHLSIEEARRLNTQVYSLMNIEKDDPRTDEDIKKEWQEITKKLKFPYEEAFTKEGIMKKNFQGFLARLKLYSIYGKKMAQGGEVRSLTEKDFVNKKSFILGNTKVILKKLSNPTAYRAIYYDLENDEKAGSYTSPDIENVLFDLRHQERVGVDLSKMAQGGEVEMTFTKQVHSGKKRVKAGELELAYFKNNEFENEIVTNSMDAFLVFTKIFDKDTTDMQESAWALFLNKRNEVIGYTELSKGGVSGTVIDAKILFAAAVKQMATGIILAHNHPSGTTKPSTADIALTKKLKDAGNTLDVTVLDHLIITSKNGYKSLADEGDMKKGGTIGQKKYTMLANIQKSDVIYRDGGSTVEKWFNPRTHTGWKKSQAQETRRRHLLDTTDKRMAMHDRYVQAGRRAQALSNVQQDEETKILAKQDADYFFEMGKKHPAKKMEQGGGVYGYALDEAGEHWKAECPKCAEEHEFKGYFDSADKIECEKCKQVFTIGRVWLDDDEYIT